MSSTPTERKQLVTFGVTMAIAFAIVAAIRVWRRGFDAIAITFCVGGLMLIRRRVAAPVAELTRTIERLAQRQYDAPVARGSNRDEFGAMSERQRQYRANYR